MIWELFGIILIGLYGLMGVIFKFPASFPNFTSTGERDERLDQLRGLAMIGIVCIHVHSYFLFFHPNEPNVTVWTLSLSNLARFSVPVFIFGSSLYLKKKTGYWKSKFLSLILPYTLATIIGYLIKFSPYSMNDFLFRFLTGQVFAPYYFVPLLIQVYLIFYILPDSFKTGTTLKLLTATCFFLNLASNLNFFNELLPSWYLPISVFNYLGFFAAGLCLRDSKVSNRKFSSLEIMSLVILLLGFILIILKFSSQHLELNNHQLIYPLFVILILNERLPKKAKSVFNKLFSFIGKNSLYIFLIHPFVIHQMHAFDPYSLGSPAKAYIITLFLNLAIPSGIAYFFTYRKERLLNQ